MKKFFTIISLIGMFVLGACSVGTVIAEQTNPIKIWNQNKNGWYQTLIVIDEDTGVNYIVVSNNSGSSSGVSISITPRYNADGTLYISGK